MLRFLTLSLCAAACFAQTPADLFNKAPADVDQALRARITEFYQLHVEGKFRQAEALVAEDTKDFYYDSSKTKYLSFQISRIEYSDGFTKAKATVLCEQYLPYPGFIDKPLKLPEPSTWKLVDGQWYYYVDQKSLRVTPFGIMGSKPAAAPAPPAGPGAPAPVNLPAKIPNLQDMHFIFSQVKADKQAVSLKPGESAEVTITNTAPGAMSITLSGRVSGVDVKLDRTELAAGGKAVLTLRAGDEPKPGVLSIQVDQTNQVIPIQVAIQ